MDYKKIGLKVGLEFHQRLDTRKLFCNCEEKEDAQFAETRRKLRAVAGELGEIDPAALHEYLKGKTFAYRSTHAASCLVELDEEPPHALNSEALGIALEIALLLNCEIADEVQVMRKTVIDGSNTSGFQRTALVGMNGFVSSANARVEIPEVYLEEESAGIVEKRDGETVYDLTRLGIPLVEIKTGIMELEPNQIGELAKKIGTLLRVTGKVKRGIGTIRQDINISVKEGERIEVKGCQELRLIPKIIENEVGRQLGLLEIRDKIRESKAPSEIQDFSPYFKDTQNKRIRAALEEKGKVLGLALRGYSGLLGKELCAGRRFGTELADYARAYAGGIIHTDEDLKKYGIERDVALLRKANSLSEKDAIVLVAAQEKEATKALEAVSRRIALAQEGIPKETRRALPDGTTEYMRPLPGSARMYPETDLPPVKIDASRLGELKKRLPEEPEKILDRLMYDYGLGEELAERMVTSRYLNTFHGAVKAGVPASVAANLFENTLRSLRRGGVDVRVFTDRHFSGLFAVLLHGKISKEALTAVLAEWGKNPSESIDGVLARGRFESAGEGRIRETVRELMKKNKSLLADKNRAFRILMGELMKEFRGKADGATISNILRSELEKP